MRKYDAKLVGFKWSPKRMGRYYPIFEYVDSYGETRTYTRKKSIEKTPFTMQRKYVICKNKGRTYEQTEKRISPKVYLLMLKILAILLVIIKPSFALIAILAPTLAIVGYVSARLFQQIKAKQMLHVKRAICGRIVGYQKTKARGLLSHDQCEYHPLIEYVYNRRAYTHMSKVACKKNEHAFHSSCNIYIDTRHQIVCDEFELNRPIVDMKKIIHIRNHVLDQFKTDNTKVYAPTPKTAQTKQSMISDTIQISIPQKAYNKKASGWY